MSTTVPPTPPDALVAQGNVIGLEVQRRTMTWRGQTLGSIVRRYLWGLFGLLILFGIWQWLSMRMQISQIASPQDVVDDLQTHFWQDPRMEVYGFGQIGYWGMLLYTIKNVLVATVIGGVIGVVGGLALARTRLLQAALEPILLTLGTLPILAAAPLLVLWFGIVSTTQIILVAAYTAILLVQFAQRAADNLNPVYEARARTCGASRFTQLRRILLPAVVPEILGGLRISLAFAWGLEVFAETLGAPKGLGQTMLTLANVDDVVGLFSCVLLIGITALLFDFLLVGAAKAVSVWQ